MVTTYEFKPDAGIKYSKIVGLADDLALALEAESIRIDRMSGRGTVGIEIPNEVRETISLREIIESDAFRKAPSRLTLALGKTVSGETYVTDLATMPHLLIAGSTGTGKSVGLNCMIASILYKATPGRGAHDPHRPQAAGAGRLRGHPPPADPGGHRPQDRGQRPQVGGRARWRSASASWPRRACATSSSSTTSSAPSGRPPPRRRARRT